jgi:hypothetical protein
MSGMSQKQKDNRRCKPRGIFLKIPWDEVRCDPQTPILKWAHRFTHTILKLPLFSLCNTITVTLYHRITDRGSPIHESS